MSEPTERDERHLARMQRKKAIIDERIANSPNECGLLLVLTGNGKGKSLSLIHISEPTRQCCTSRMPSSA